MEYEVITDKTRCEERRKRSDFVKKSLDLSPI